jgi:uncharacterized protein
MSGQARQHAVDRLRGFALLGVLIVNTPFLMTSVAGISEISMPTIWDRTAGFITWALFQAKSYVIFSFIFGYSLTIFLERALAKGIDGRRAYRQRLLALAVIGAVHAVLLFVGDILFIYALLGASLLWLRRKSDRTLLRFAAVFYAAQVVVMAGLLALAFMPAGDSSNTVDSALGVDIASIDTSWATDGLWGASLTRLEVWPFALVLIIALQGLLVLSLFCVGMVAGRRKWLADPDAHRETLRRVRRWGYWLGLPPSLLGAALIIIPGADADPGRFMVGVVLIYLTAPVLSAAYVATIALLRPSRVTRILEGDGKMSLSIYLGESLLMTTLAAGWGFGLFGLNTAAALLVALGVWIVLSVMAGLWHRWFGPNAPGPAERLLRRMTYAGISTTSPPGGRE